jgi:hypothetical protein
MQFEGLVETDFEVHLETDLAGTVDAEECDWEMVRVEY